MQRRFPISLIGLFLLMLAFIFWYSWTTSPMAQAARENAASQQPRNDQPAPVAAPSKEDVKKQLDANKPKTIDPATPKKLVPDPDKPLPKAEPRKPNPTSEPADYWWKELPVDTKKGK